MSWSHAGVIAYWVAQTAAIIGGVLRLMGNDRKRYGGRRRRW